MILFEKEYLDVIIEGTQKADPGDRQYGTDLAARQQGADLVSSRRKSHLGHAEDCCKELQSATNHDEKGQGYQSQFRKEACRPVYRPHKVGNGTIETFPDLTSFRTEEIKKSVRNTFHDLPGNDDQHNHCLDIFPALQDGENHQTDKNHRTQHGFYLDHPTKERPSGLTFIRELSQGVLIQAE